MDIHLYTPYILYCIIHQSYQRSINRRGVPPPIFLQGAKFSILFLEKIDFYIIFLWFNYWIFIYMNEWMNIIYLKLVGYFLDHTGWEKNHVLYGRLGREVKHYVVAQVVKLDPPHDNIHIYISTICSQRHMRHGILVG